MGLEYEKKYRADRETLDLIDNALTEPSYRLEMETTYYDTPDGALSARKITLRRRYENGVLCNYNLTAQANYEGMTVMIDGEKGRIEFESRIYRDLETQKDDVQDTNTVSQNKLTLCRYGSGFPEEIAINQTEGGHGGADTLIVQDLFCDKPSRTLATLEDGIQAVLVAAAVNQSLARRQPAEVQGLMM